MKIRASVYIKVSGVRVDREANISDSGKQAWALIQRRTAFLQERKRKVYTSHRWPRTVQKKRSFR